MMKPTHIHIKKNGATVTIMKKPLENVHLECIFMPTIELQTHCIVNFCISGRNHLDVCWNGSCAGISRCGCTQTSTFSYRFHALVIHLKRWIMHLNESELYTLSSMPFYFYYIPLRQSLIENVEHSKRPYLICAHSNVILREIISFACIRFR